VRTAWLALGLPVLLTACAQLPDWQGKAVLQQPVPQTLQAAAGAPQVAWPQDRWWQRYGDSQLDSLIAEALEHAPDMAAAPPACSRPGAAGRERGGLGAAAVGPRQASGTSSATTI
jgi:outer membrane protein TolC